jgi:hypothetical protein
MPRNAAATALASRLLPGEFASKVDASASTLNRVWCRFLTVVKEFEPCFSDNPVTVLKRLANCQNTSPFAVTMTVLRG